MERKQFIKSACTMCMALGAGITLLELSACSQLPVVKASVEQNKVAIPASLFNNAELQIIRPKGFEYDIALRKEHSGNYTALLLRCTHGDNQLVTTDNGFTCNMHGSIFDKEGTVKQGPAELPLKQLTAQLIDDNIIIKLN